MRLLGAEGSSSFPKKMGCSCFHTGELIASSVGIVGNGREIVLVGSLEGGLQEIGIIGCRGFVQLHSEDCSSSSFLNRELAR